VGRDIKIQANLYYLPQCNIVWCFIENTQVSEKVVHHSIQNQNWCFPKLVLASICNLVRVHVCFIYLTVYNGVKALDI